MILFKWKWKTKIILSSSKCMSWRVWWKRKCKGLFSFWFPKKVSWGRSSDNIMLSMLHDLYNLLNYNILHTINKHWIIYLLSRYLTMLLLCAKYCPLYYGRWSRFKPKSYFQLIWTQIYKEHTHKVGRRLKHLKWSKYHRGSETGEHGKYKGNRNQFSLSGALRNNKNLYKWQIKREY